MYLFPHNAFENWCAPQPQERAFGYLEQEQQVVHAAHTRLSSIWKKRKKKCTKLHNSVRRERKSHNQFMDGNYK